MPAKEHALETGFSLIEVLVALMLLSIGLLAIVAIEVKSLQLTQQAFQHSLALQQVSNLFERLQAVATTSERQQQCLVWQQKNKIFLPNAVSDCSQKNNTWQVSLKWGKPQSQQLKFEMRL